MKSKKHLADSIRELMARKPIEKITIKEILETADVSKATFYRHFQDKYDLMNYYFRKSMEDLCSFDVVEMGRGEERAVMALTFLSNNKSYFLNAYKSEGFNNFTDYQYQYYYDSYCRSTLAVKGELTTEDEVAIKFYCAGVAFIVKDWLTGGCKISPENMAELLHSFLPKQIPLYY